MASAAVATPLDHHAMSYAEVAAVDPVESPSKASGTSDDTLHNGQHNADDEDDDESMMTKSSLKRSDSRTSTSSRIKRVASGEDFVRETYNDNEKLSLTSLKPTEDFEDSLHRSHEEENSEEDHDHDDGNVLSELVSGRQAAAGWETSGIRFAPLNVPLKRRLQTLTVLIHSLIAVTTVTFFFLLCAIPLLWPIIVPYLVYVLMSRAGTSGTLWWRSQKVRGSKVWSLFASYFPMRLHRTAELPATRKYVFGYHPHGIISHGAFASFCTNALGFNQLFPGITNTLLTLDSNFRIPLYREYLLLLGLQSVARESCESILSKGGVNGQGMGRGITIVVGGAAESLEAKPGTLRLVLARRKGFVKLAIRAGADLVPVLAFGENDLYEQLDPEAHPALHKFQLGFKKLMGFTMPIFHARGVFNYDVGIMPYRRPLNIVVGRPIQVQQQKGKPDDAYVDEIHEKYIQELESIWNNYKDVFAPNRSGEFELHT